MRIEYLYRYPVKGLSAEALEAAEVQEAKAIPWDRAFALAQGDADFDPAQPKWLPKQNFMCGQAIARTALLQCLFEARSGRLTITAPSGAGVSANALTPAGREEIGRFLADFLGPEARGTPRFHHIPGHVFSDSRIPVISLINLASLRELEARVGARRHRRRFRANVWFTGTPAWSEFDWLGRELQLGGAVLRVLKRIPRCAATEVNPLTAERDAHPVAELREHFGHGDLGVYAEVIEGGTFAVGDGIELLPD